MYPRRPSPWPLPILVVLAPVVAFAAAQNEPLFPQPPSDGSILRVEYLQIPQEALTGKDVSEATIAADFEPLAPYAAEQGSLIIGDQDRRYDVIGWMADRATGQRVRFISPIKAPGSAGERSATDNPMSCTLTESVECPDGSTVSVMCSGMTGSCVSCSVGKTACCRASTEGDEVFKNGRVQRIIIITRESESCPPPPEPRPGEQPPRVMR